jgi:hypothetical protein
MVRVPDAAGQFRSAPLRLLRGFFSGIGQLLLAADRGDAEDGRHERVSSDDQLDPPTGLDDPPTTRASARFSIPAKRSFDSTGNVRLLSPDDPADTLDNIRRPKARGSKRAGARHSPGRHRAGRAARAATKAPPAPASSADASSADASSADAQAELLMPGYAGLSLPAVRARLRGLDQAQLSILLACEKSSANRADIVTLFERRIAKLEAAGRDGT